MTILKSSREPKRPVTRDRKVWKLILHQAICRLWWKRGGNQIHKAWPSLWRCSKGRFEERKVSNVRMHRTLRRSYSFVHLRISFRWQWYVATVSFAEVLDNWIYVYMQIQWIIFCFIESTLWRQWCDIWAITNLMNVKRETWRTPSIKIVWGIN